MKKIDRLQRTVLWLAINPDTGRADVKKFSWKDCEPALGEYHFEALEEESYLAEQAGKCFFLQIMPEIPAWSVRPQADYNAFLWNLAEYCRGKAVIYSIDVTIPEGLSESARRTIANTYSLAFPEQYKMIRLECEELIRYFRHADSMGIILSSDADPAQTGIRIAKLGLQKVWEQAPIRLDGEGLSRDMIKNAVRWHVSAVDTTEDAEDIDFAPMGYRPEVRRCYTVDEVRNGETLPLAVWTVNTGNAPSYLESSYCVRLMRVDGDDELVWDTGVMGKDCYPGEDICFETQIPIEGLPAAEYDLQIGIFDRRTGYPVSMGIEGRISDGYYMTFLKLHVVD